MMTTSILHKTLFIFTIIGLSLTVGEENTIITSNQTEAKEDMKPINLQESMEFDVTSQYQQFPLLERKYYEYPQDNSDRYSMNNVSMLSDSSELIVTDEALYSGTFSLEKIDKICKLTLSSIVSPEYVEKYTTISDYLADNIKTPSSFIRQSGLGYTGEDEYSLLNKQTNQYFYVRRYSVDDFNSFRNEASLLYRLQRQVKDQDSFFPNYEGCANEDSFLYLFTSEYKEFKKLSSSEMKSKIAKLNGKNLKKYFINIAETLAQLHRWNISHGFFTLDNILADSELENFKLWNFKYSHELNYDILDITKKTNGFIAAVEPKTVEDLYYNDIINLILIFMYYDTNVYNNFIIPLEDKYRAEVILQNMEQDFINKLIQSKKTLKESMMLALQKYVRPNADLKAKKNDSNGIFDFLSCCFKRTDRFEKDNYIEGRKVTFNKLQNAYIALMNLDRDALSVAHVLFSISVLNKCYFGTWVTSAFFINKGANGKNKKLEKQYGTYKIYSKLNPIHDLREGHVSTRNSFSIKKEQQEKGVRLLI